MMKAIVIEGIASLDVLLGKAQLICGVQNRGSLCAAAKTRPDVGLDKFLKQSMGAGGAGKHGATLTSDSNKMIPAELWPNPKMRLRRWSLAASDRLNLLLETDTVDRNPPR